VGRTIARKLSLGVRSFGEPLSIMVPKPGIGFINPINAFYKTNVQIVGLYKGTEDFESKFVFEASINFNSNAVIALFNVSGTIMMMIIDKKNNLKTLFNLGATVKEIKKVFIFQGFLLTFTGMIIGLVLGIILVLLQNKFGLLMIVEGLPYPVELRFINLIIVFLTITILGFLAAKIASSRISKEFIEK